MLAQGVIPDDRPHGEKDPRGHRRYLLMDVLQLALVFQLQRAPVDPVAAAAFVTDNRQRLEEMWVKATIAMDPYWLDIEIDAYAVLGGEGKGRPAGRVGALAFPGTRERRGIAEPTSVLRVDLPVLRTMRRYSDGLPLWLHLRIKAFAKARGLAFAGENDMLSVRENFAKEVDAVLPATGVADRHAVARLADSAEGRAYLGDAIEALRVAGSVSRGEQDHPRSADQHPR